jgi:hypothetical protein
MKRLRAAYSGAWEDNISVWIQYQAEYNSYLANYRLMAISGKSNRYILRHGIESKLALNRSVFVGIIAYEGESEKRVISNMHSSTKLLSISPLVSVAPGN